MKKLFFATFMLASVAFSANAQKGSVLVFGNVGFGSEGQGDSKTSTVDFSPSVGYQFNDNWLAGVELSIGSKKQPSEEVLGKDVTASTFKVGPFVRYAHSFNSTFGIVGHLGVGYQGMSEKTEGVDGKAKASGMYATVYPAITVSVHNGFGFSFAFGSLGFDSMKADVKDAKAYNTFGFKLGHGFGLGVFKSFGGGKK